MKHLCRNVKNISVNDKNGISYNNYDTTSMYYDLRDLEIRMSCIIKWL